MTHPSKIRFALLTLTCLGLVLAGCAAPQPTPLPPVATAAPTEAAPTAVPPAPTSAPTVAPTPRAKDVYETLKADPKFATLISAIDAAQLDKALTAPGPIVLFAPNEDAFKQLPADQLSALLKDPAQLADVLYYHVVAGRFSPTELGSINELRTALATGRLSVSTQGTTLRVNEAAVTVPPIEAANGLIYPIAQVLLPQAISAPVTATQPSGVLTGTVTYLQRSALPDNASVEVQLQDTSLADAPAKVIASQTIETKGRQVPIGFELTYDPAMLDGKARYTLSARITADNQLLFINTTSIPVLTGNAPVTNIEVMVEPVANTAASASPTTTVSAQLVTSYTASLTGTLTYRDRRALTPDAVIVVQLVDVSKADAPGLVIASDNFAAAGKQVPLPFDIRYDPAWLDAKNTYALQARILYDGRVSYRSTQRYEAVKGGEAQSGLEVLVEAQTSTAAATDLATITGTVTYLNRSALPAAAILEVDLLDTSLADAPARVVSRQVYQVGEQQVPLPFTLYYDPFAIDPARKYSLAARLSVEGKPLYRTTTDYAVLTAGQLSDVELLVSDPNAPALTTPAPVTGTGTLTGTVTYRERIALSPNAVVEVSLQDVSRADAAAITVVSQTINANGQQVPLAYSLVYDTAKVSAGNRYAVRATIKEDGQLRWTSTQNYAVLTGGAPTTGVEIMVEQVAATTPPPVQAADVLTGVVTYRERVALPAEAVINVRLLDVTNLEVPAIVVGEQTIETQGQQVPVPFSIEFDLNTIDPSHFYLILATISTGGELAWLNNQPLYVLTYGNPSTNFEVVVKPVP